MSGLFSNDGDGWVHDCDFPRPTRAATFICPECDVKHFTALRHDYKAWVWVSAETGKARL